MIHSIQVYSSESLTCISAYRDILLSPLHASQHTGLFFWVLYMLHSIHDSSSEPSTCFTAYRIILLSPLNASHHTGLFFWDLYMLHSIQDSSSESFTCFTAWLLIQSCRVISVSNSWREQIFRQGLCWQVQLCNFYRVTHQLLARGVNRICGKNLNLR